MTLSEHCRQTQILLELHRRDPDDEQTWQQFEQAKAHRDAAWLEHTVNAPA